MKYRLIQIIAEDKISGAPRHLLDLVRGLLEDKKFSILIICPPGKLARAFEKLASSNLEIEPTFMKSKFDFRAIGKIRALIKSQWRQHHQNAKVIIHCHGTRAGWLGRLASIGQKPLVVYTEHLWTLDYRPASPILGFFQLCGLWFLDLFTNLTIAVSGAVAEFLVVAKITRAAKIVVIPHGIMTTKARPKKDRPKGNFVIGSVGSLNWVKGYKYLIRGVAEIVKHRPKPTLKVVLVGEGPEKGKLQRLAKKLDISQQVRFLGFSDEVEKTLKDFDLYVQPSLSESFGLAAAQAMAQNVPVVLSAVGGLPEVLGVGEWSETLEKGQMLQTECGVLVSSRDSQGLSRAMEFIIDHPEEARKMAQNAHNQIKDNFSLQRMIEATKRVYERV